jgi:HAD superfamily hydrolase (TIGR01509 family)
MPIRAFIFDCNGVLCDDEPYHFLGLQRALADAGIALTQQQYLDDYITFDDRGSVRHALEQSERPPDGPILDDLVDRKRRYYKELVEKDLRLFPGVEAFVRAAASRYPTAIASGAIRPEIDRILLQTGIRGCFRTIVSAEDVVRCKPAPDCYHLARERLNRLPEFAQRPLQAPECLVLEDSRGGVTAAREAGMRVAAIANSVPPEALSHADRVLPSLDGTLPWTLASLWD